MHLMNHKKEDTSDNGDKKEKHKNHLIERDRAWKKESEAVKCLKWFY